MSHDPQILIFKHKAAAADFAAMRFVEMAQRSVSTIGRFSVALSGGGTPQMFFERLALPPIASQVPWSHVHIFWSDERLVAPTENGSNYRQAFHAFISKVAIPTDNVWRMKGELDPTAAQIDYANQIDAFMKKFDLSGPQLNLVMLGMGGDGHTASLFPGSEVENSAYVLPIVAEYEDRPANRITLTSTLINYADAVWFLVTGEGKAKMVPQVIQGKFDPVMLPAQRIRPKSGTLTWLLDEDAAQNLEFLPISSSK